MKRNINIFISFAVKNSQLAASFVENFEEYIKPSKNYAYTIWRSSKLQAGQDWDETIKREMQRCDCALLLVSPAFLNSEYIIQTELPVLLEKQVLLPVMLYDVDLTKHDLHGLEKFQIFRLEDENFKAPRAYYNLKPKRRGDFIKTLFDQLEARLDEER